MELEAENKVRLIEGGIVVDDRGCVSFANDADLQAVRRFYTVTNHRAGFVRAWHAHRREAKFAVALDGSAVIAAVKIDDWTSPSADLEVQRFVLSEKDSRVLFIPPGFANGFMSLTPDMRLMFLSTLSLEESLGDDFRYPSRYWDPWRIEER